MTRPLCFACIALLTMAGANADELSFTEGLVKIRVSPGEGGRLTFLSFDGSPNLLAYDARALVPEHSSLPVHERPFLSTGGMTVWLAPQKYWWREQTLHSWRQENKAVWPPDPFGEAALFAVESKSRGHAKLTGPPSPVSGMQLVKEMRLSAVGVDWIFHALNTGPVARSWALWPNLRIPMNSEIWVETHRLPKHRDWIVSTGDWVVVSGRDVPEGEGEKIQFHGWSGRAVIFIGGVAWLLTCEPNSRVPPGHGELEIYVNAPLHEGRCIEIEPIGEFHSINIGESMEMRMAWRFKQAPHGLPFADREKIISRMFEQ